MAFESTEGFDAAVHPLFTCLSLRQNCMSFLLYLCCFLLFSDTPKHLLFQNLILGLFCTHLSSFKLLNNSLKLMNQDFKTWPLFWTPQWFIQFVSWYAHFMSKIITVLKCLKPSSWFSLQSWFSKDFPSHNMHDHFSVHKGQKAVSSLTSFFLSHYKMKFDFQNISRVQNLLKPPLLSVFCSFFSLSQDHCYSILPAFVPPLSLPFLSSGTVQIQLRFCLSSPQTLQRLTISLRAEARGLIVVLRVCIPEVTFRFMSLAAKALQTPKASLAFQPLPLLASLP